MANKYQNHPFKGRITYQHQAHTEFTGKPPVLIPDSSDEVVAAFATATAGGRTIYIRSGEVINTANVVTDNNAAVISLEALKSIEIDLQRIRVGPATTVGELATALRNRALFLPLSDDPTLSLASAVLGERRLAFPESVSRRQPLWHGVVEAVVVSPKGEVTTLDTAQWRRNQSVRRLRCLSVASPTASTPSSIMSPTRATVGSIRRRRHSTKNR